MTRDRFANQRADHLDRPVPGRDTVAGRDAVADPSDSAQDRGALVATRDHEHVRAWADAHDATPATGLQTDSGSAAVDVHDGGAAIRFNFPAAAQFRPIAWDEWFAIFDRDGLVFVYEPQPTDGGAFGSRGAFYYRLLPADKWKGPLTNAGPSAPPAR